MSKLLPIVLVTAVASLVVSRWLWPPEAVAASTEVRSTADNSDCWTTSLLDDCFHSVWLGPRLHAPGVGGFRFVNVVFCDLQCPDSFAAIASVAQADSSQPVTVANGTLRLVATPRDGTSWSDVGGSSDLSVEIERLP